MSIFHDSRDPVYRAPQGAVSCGSTLRLRVRAEDLHRVSLRLWWQDSESLLPMKPAHAGLYECELKLPAEPGLLWYFFVAEGYDGKTWYFGNAADGLGGHVGKRRTAVPLNNPPLLLQWFRDTIRCHYVVRQVGLCC